MNKQDEYKKYVSNVIEKWITQERPIEEKVNGLVNYINELGTDIIDFYVKILLQINEQEMTQQNWNDVLESHRLVPKDIFLTEYEEN